MTERNLNLDVYKEALLSKAAECRNDLEGARKEISIETTAEAMEHGSRAAERELAVERMETFYRLLLQVESALSRIERGTFGICLKCEDEAGQKRLDALPWAVLCLQCQEAAELVRESAGARRYDVRRAA